MSLDTSELWTGCRKLQIGRGFRQESKSMEYESDRLVEYRSLKDSFILDITREF